MSDQENKAEQTEKESNLSSTAPDVPVEKAVEDKTDEEVEQDG